MTIITHPGAAHLDDILASSVLRLVGVRGAIERRDPTADELENSLVHVIDVGGVYDPEHSNYDHHQSRDLPCALSLVWKEYGRYAKTEFGFEEKDFEPFLTRVSVMDTRGPRAFASEVAGVETMYEGFHQDSLFGVLPAIAGENGEDFERAVEIGAEILRAMFKELGAKRANFNLYTEKTSEVSVGGLRGVMFPGEETTGFHDWLKERGIDPAFSVNYDNRGEGFTLYRFNDHPRIDFSRLEGHGEIIFAHKGGFIAKTSKRLGREECLELIKASLV